MAKWTQDDTPRIKLLGGVAIPKIGLTIGSCSFSWAAPRDSAWWGGHRLQDEDEQWSGGSCQSQHIGQCSGLSARLCPALPGRVSRTSLQACIKDSEECMVPFICYHSRSTNFEHALPQDSLAALDCVSEWCQLNSCSKEEWLYILYVITEHMLKWHMKSGHTLPM